MSTRIGNAKRRKELTEKLLSEQLGSTKNSIPHVVEVFEMILKAWGGKEQFARDVYKTWVDAKPGSNQQARLIETVLGGVRFIHENNLMGVQDDDPAAMDDDSLQAFVKAVAKEITDPDDES